MRIGALRGLSCSDRASTSKVGAGSAATRSQRADALTNRQQCLDPRALRSVQLLDESKKVIHEVTQQLLEKKGDSKHNSSSKPELPVSKAIRQRYSRIRL
jgi:hypothetical protein